MTDMPKIQPLAPERTSRWEYMTLSYNYSYGSTTYEINGEKEVRLKNMPLHEALSLLGQQGWELVSIAEGKLCVLKRVAAMRPKATSTPGK